MKPRIKRDEGLWYCSGGNCIAYAHTPERAYIRWREISAKMARQGFASYASNMVHGLSQSHIEAVFRGQINGL